MLKQGTFIKKKFNRLMLGNIWGCLAFGINLMIDSLISGNQLGETSLAAVSIVFPISMVCCIFGDLISPGASVLFGKYVGEFDDERAYRCAGSSLCFSIIIGILIAAILWILKFPILNYYGCTGELLQEASAYYNWVIAFAILKPISTYLFYLLVTDGEATLLSVGSTLDIVANIVLSVVLSRIFGVAGLGMATCMGLFLYILCCLGHFLKKSNNVKLRLCLDLNIFRRSVVLSFSNYMYYLFVAVVDIVFNKIIITNCGVKYIPAYSVVNLIFSVCEVFLCIYNSGVGFITCFYGERNNHGLNIVFRKIMSSIIVMAVCVTIFFFFAAPLMPIIYGLETPVTIQASIMACRIMSFTSLGFGFIYVFSMVLSSVEKPFMSFFMTFLGDGLAPLLLSLVFGSIWDFTGIVIGMSLSTYFAVGIYSLVMIMRKGKKGYPVYVEDFGEEGFSYDLYVKPEALVELRNAVSGELRVHGFDNKNIDLLLEEFFTRLMEKNPGKKVLAECTLLFAGDHVRILIRDDGVLFNFTDANNRIESLNAHVLNSILEQTREKNYIITTAFNRNGFVFEK